MLLYNALGKSIPHLKLSSITEWLRLVSIIIVIILLTRYFPLGDKSDLMNVSLIAYFFLSQKYVFQFRKDKLTLYMLLFITFFACYSIYLGNQPLLVLRFYVVFLLIYVSYYAPFVSWATVKCISTLYILHALILIGLSIAMTLLFGKGDYSIVRNFFMLNNYGDIYTYGNGFYRVQLRGNALLPFFFMVSCYIAWLKSSTFYLVASLVLFFGVVFAGNLAYYISLVVFGFAFIFMTSTSVAYLKRNVFLLLLGFMSLISIGAKVFFDILETKLGGDDSSLGVRADQVSVLFNDLNQSLTSVLFGKGFGNVLSVNTFVRDYSDAIYYEVQTAYMLNQLGVIPFLLIVFSFVMLSVRYINDKFLLLILCCYVLYASTNPYIFDTNHVVVIVVLVSLSRMLSNSYKHNNILTSKDLL